MIIKDGFDLSDNVFDGKSLHFTNISYLTPYINFKNNEHLKLEKVETCMNIKNEFQSYNRLK